jgi:hypothetical protein
VKAPRRITHQQRLRRAGAALGRFYAAAAELGDALGPVLFQVPPTLPKDLPLLEEFLSLLPRRRRAAFQLHGEWLSPDVLDALARRGAALCVVDADDGRRRSLRPPTSATCGCGGSTTTTRRWRRGRPGSRRSRGPTRSSTSGTRTPRSVPGSRGGSRSCAHRSPTTRARPRLARDGRTRATRSS